MVRRAVLMCRSRQLQETFSLPPTNHLAYGIFHASPFFYGLNQCSSRANRSKNITGFRAASS